MCKRKKYGLQAGVFLLSTAAFLFAGCQDMEPTTSFKTETGSEYISFEIGKKTAVVKSAVLKEGGEELGQMILTAPDGLTGVVLGCTEEKTGDPVFKSSFFEETSFQTKAVQVDGRNIDELYANKLSVVAYKSDKSAYIPAQTITCNTPSTTAEGASYWKTSSSYLWPSDELEFWGWAPLASVTIAENHKTASVTGYVTPADVKDQQDVIIAQKTCSAADYNGKVPLEFNHAMSAIKFKLGATDAGTVKSITIKNAMSKGDFEFNPVYTEEPILWDNLNTPANFTYTYNQVVSENMDKENPVALGDSTATFMLIPQSRVDSEEVAMEFVLVFTNNTSGTDETYTSKVTVNWKAGYTYTYVLSNIGGSLEVNVEDTVDGIVKKDLAITSTDNSTVKCYIRAAIIGNWFENTGTATEPIPGKIISPWSKADGTFDPALPSTAGSAVNNWVLGADGYYYYKYPVYPGTETGTGSDGEGTADKLFTTYTSPEIAPIEGTYLKLDIVVQGVKWDNEKNLVTEAWGTTAAGYLSVNDKGSN